MKKIIGSFIFLALSSCQTTRHVKHDDFTGDLFATTTLKPKSGSKAKGAAWFFKTKNGLKIVVSVTGSTKGLHGIHIHEKGDCSAYDASSAGEHFNPIHLHHGHPDPTKYHAGDLGNIDINKDGSGTLSLFIPMSNFNPDMKDWNSIIGKSLVLHDKRDDLVSQPSGDSGSRIACGVIKQH
jgi:Cu-Zn family superoxide dismutase